MSAAATLPTGHGQKPHAVCVPFPAQGHITPMLKLAKILHARGFRVTFVNTEYNHRRLVRSRGAAAVAGLAGFRFATIPDGLPESDADATQDPATISYATKHNCPPHLRSLLAGLDGVTCVVADNLMSFAVDAARDMGVPCALFWTASACGYMGYRNFRLLIDMGIIPFQGSIYSLATSGPLHPYPIRRKRCEFFFPVAGGWRRRRAADERVLGHADGLGAGDEQAHAAQGLPKFRALDGPRRVHGPLRH